MVFFDGNLIAVLYALHGNVLLRFVNKRQTESVSDTARQLG